MVLGQSNLVLGQNNLIPIGIKWNWVRTRLYILKKVKIWLDVTIVGQRQTKKDRATQPINGPWTAEMSKNKIFYTKAICDICDIFHIWGGIPHICRFLCTSALQCTHCHIIKAGDKYTKKSVNLRQNSLNWSKLADISRSPC